MFLTPYTNTIARAVTISTAMPRAYIANPRSRCRTTHSLLGITVFLHQWYGYKRKARQSVTHQEHGVFLLGYDQRSSC
jgi:hypothetical protein